MFVCLFVCLFVYLQHMWMFVDDCGEGSVDLGPVGRVDGPLDTPTCNDAVKVISGTHS